MTIRTFAAAALASALLAAPVFAQTADLVAHHPQEGAAATAAPSGTGKTSGKANMPGMSGMMGGGMMQGGIKPNAAMPKSGMPMSGMGR
jgi:hypothetical protein